MIKVIINGRQYTPLELSITKRLSGVDSCFISLGETGSKIVNDVIERKTVQIFEDSMLLFEGFGENPQVSENIIEFSCKGKLGRLAKINLPYDLIFQDYDLIEFLNSNDYGIVFKDYNLETYQQIFSLKLSLQNYFEALTQLSEVYGFKFWYDYNQDVCLVGEPDRIIKVDSQDVLAGEVIINLPIQISTSNQANFLQVYGGGIDKVSLDAATQEMQDKTYSITEQPNIFEVDANKKTYVIKDDESIQKYGILADSIVSSSVDYSSLTNEGKAKAANLLLVLGSAELKTRKDPLVRLDNFVYFLEEKYLIATHFSNGNVFQIKTNINHRDKESVLIDDTFLIADVTYKFSHNSTEGAYECTLINKLPTSSKQNKLLSNIARTISRSSSTLTNRVLNFVLPVKQEPSKVEFSLDTDYKKIKKYEMYLVITPASNAKKFDLSRISIFIDNYKLNALFDVNVIEVLGAEAVRVPVALNIDLLNNPILQESEINSIINNEKGNKHSFTVINEGSTVETSVAISLIIESEI